MKAIKDRYALGERLYNIREERKLSQTKVAEVMGVRPATVSKIESGTFSPSLELLFKYCQAVGRKIFIE